MTVTPRPLASLAYYYITHQVPVNSSCRPGTKKS